MKNIGRITIFTFLLFSSVGCAIYVKQPYPSYSDITSIKGEKVAEKANILISEKDLSLEHSVHFGLIGYLFPTKVQVGKTLKVYAEEYFSEIFNEITFNNQQTDSIFIILTIKEFDISAFKTMAHLEIKIVVNDKNKNQILEKNYSADGGGHFPIYGSEVQQFEQVQSTTGEAFKKVFEDIIKDVKANQLRNMDVGSFENNKF